MDDVTTLRGYPNVLAVIGPDVYSRNADDDYRDRLRDLLYDRDRRPVREGSHDFWITYPVPQVRDAPSQFGYEDFGVRPRPQRGIIRMNELPTDASNLDQLKGHLRVLFQEVGHHWLVPDDLQFRRENGDVVGLDRDLGEHLVDGERLEGLPLLGRDNSHWSAYWDADASPLDGQDYERLEPEDGFAHWRHAPTFNAVDPPNLTFNGLSFYPRGILYNDLDLAIMGVIRPQTAYGGGPIRWLVPRLTAPLRYEVGLFVAFGRYDFMFFGFDRDHRRLLARRSYQRVYPRVALGRLYRPLAADGFNGVQLRIVRRGDQYYCQARYDTDAGDRSRRRIPGLFGDLADLPGRTSGPWTSFRTVATMPSSSVPRAVGLYVLTRERSFLAEGAFFNLELRVGDRTFRYRFEDNPPVVDVNDALTDLPSDEVVAHIPGEGARVEAADGQLTITAPWVLDGDERPFNHVGLSDRLPKVLRRVPDRDFVVGTAARVRRAIITPAAGGYAARRDYWGRERSIEASQVILPDRQAEKRERPLDNVFKAAFIIVAPTMARAQAAVAQVDAVRQAWERAFEFSMLRNDAVGGGGVVTAF